MSESTAADFQLVTPRRRWTVRPVEDAAVAALVSSLGLLRPTARILAGRGLATADQAEAWLHPTLDGLHSPFLFREMEAAVDRLMRALRQQERIVIHGDYDVDGISGTVLLVTVLRHLGGDVDFILPHRIDDGYGLGRRGVDRAHDLGAAVLIAVDCGVTAHPACERARELGIDVIIVDHHLPKETLPDALAILDPRLPDAGYPEDDLAAVGLAFKLARGLLARSGSGFSGLSMLKLVALGTIADLVPLRGENRLMAYHGLEGLADAVNPGLRALLQVSGVEGRKVNAGDVGFRLAPRINAAGRIGHPREAADLFLTGDPAEARRLAGRLQQLNAERQQIERGVFEEALQSGFDGAPPVIVASGEGWHRGVIGIVASRLVDKTGRPALVISVAGDRAYGSARSVPGFSIVAALDAVRDVLDEYGGHHQAAGFSLATGRLADLAEGLCAHAVAAPPPAAAGDLVCDDWLELEGASTALALELDRLAPFGIGNPRPRFLCTGCELVRPPLLLGDQHLKLLLRGPQGDLEAVAWRRGDLLEALGGAREVSMVATLKARSWGGRLRAQLEIEDLGA